MNAIRVKGSTMMKIVMNARYVAYILGQIWEPLSITKQITGIDHLNKFMIIHMINIMEDASTSMEKIFKI